MASSTPRPSKLKIVLDTNTIYSPSEGEFFAHRMKALVKSPRPHSTLSLEWYLPDIVLREREYQLRLKALDLQAKIKKLERYIGRSVDITPSQVRDSLRTELRRQSDELGFQIVPLSANQVAWDKLIEDSLDRNPPFQGGSADTEKETEKEKGFRDALILETFLQFVSDPKNKGETVILVFVIYDKLLRETTQSKLKQMKNVRVLQSIDELGGLINTLADSQIREEFIARIKPKVEKFFFNSEDPRTIESVRKLIQEISTQFASELESHPPIITRRVNKSPWTIYPPTFLKKEGDRYYWTTQIVVNAEGFRNVPFTRTFNPYPTASYDPSVGTTPFFYSAEPPYQPLSPSATGITAPSAFTPLPS